MNSRSNHLSFTKPRKSLGLSLALLALISIPGLVRMAQAATPNLVWSDDFNQADGSSPNSSKWAFELGGGGWGNNELETYTSSTDNARVVSDPNASNGKALEIRAIKTNSGGYTSARINTKSTFTFTYGRIEARIKVPNGQGLWPAFWMLGKDVDTVGWPNCGEIDIMESINANPKTVYGTLHGPGYSGANGIQGTYSLSSGTLDQAYHVYAVDRSPNKIVWSIDGQVYHTVTPVDIPAGTQWVFNNSPFYIILNLAVGGGWPGNPDSTTTFPQSLTVDYVRVYDLAPAAPSTAGAFASGPTEATISWQPPTSTDGGSPAGYQIDRATDSAFTQNVVTQSVGPVTSYVDSTVAANTTYYYRISTENAGGLSTPTDPIKVVTPAAAATGTATMVNISTRAYCGTGDQVAIGGFVIGGSGSKRVLLRAIGPTLSSRGLATGDVLADPTIDLYKGNTVIATNDNWTDNANSADVVSVGSTIGAGAIDSGDTTSAALLLTLPSGPYTFIVRGKNNTTGIVLVEAFDAD